MKIPEWPSHEIQMCKIGRHQWSVSRLIQLSVDFPVLDVPIDHLNVYFTYDKLTSRQMVMHFNAVQDANLGMPIILDEDGEIMDGRHRIMKAMMLGIDKIKAVRFQENPPPCLVTEE